VAEPMTLEQAARRLRSATDELPQSWPNHVAAIRVVLTALSESQDEAGRMREALRPFAAYFHPSQLRMDGRMLSRRWMPDEPGYESGGEVGVTSLDFQRARAALAPASQEPTAQPETMPEGCTCLSGKVWPCPLHGGPPEQPAALADHAFVPHDPNLCETWCDHACHIPGCNLLASEHPQPAAQEPA
jgi:hypothetical protein